MPSCNLAMPKKGGKILKAFVPKARWAHDEDFSPEEFLDGEVVDRVCNGLSEGQIGIVPTETVYGLVASTQGDALLDRIYAIKSRENDRPLPVQIGSVGQLADLGVQMNRYAQFLADNFWPGPLTLVLPFLGADRCRIPIAPNLLKQWGKNKTVAVRIPDHVFALSVLKKMGIPLIATSANRSGEEPMVRVGQITPVLRTAVDWVVDAGPTQYQRESTVVACDSGGWRILREGALRGVVLQKALQSFR